MSKTSSRNGALPSAVNRSASGASRLGLRLPSACAASTRAMETSSLSIEVFVKIRGKQHYLWRAVDQDGDVVDVLLQNRRDASAAKRFLRRLIRRHGQSPGRSLLTNWRGTGLPIGHWCLIHCTSPTRYANNRAEQSHEATRFRERGMRRFKSAAQAQRFLEVHSAVHNLSNLGRHLVRASHYRDLRQRAFASWSQATAA